MFSKQIVSAFAASALVAGVVGIGCDDETATIRSTGDAEELSNNCREIEGNLVIDTPGNENTDILLTGITSVGGDFIAKDNKGIRSIQADNLRTIGGDFRLENIINLNTLSMVQLTEVGTLNFATLTGLNSFDFGTAGISSADEVIIADTRLESIDGINVESPSTMNLNNNPRLANFTSSIKSLSTELIIQTNALQLEVNLPELTWIANMTISDVNSFSVPNLEVVNGSMRFYDNKFRSFEAPMLKKMDEGDLSFVSHGDLTNLSFPALKSVAGGFTIANNTKLTDITGFPKLTTIGGAGAMRGAFEEIELPSLNQVSGVMEIESTEKIDPICEHFEGLQGVEIEGKVRCEGDDEDALGNTDEAGGGGGGGSGGSGSGGDGEDAASIMTLSMSTIAAIAGLSMVFTMF